MELKTRIKLGSKWTFLVLLLPKVLKYTCFFRFAEVC